MNRRFEGPDGRTYQAEYRVVQAERGQVTEPSYRIRFYTADHLRPLGTVEVRGSTGAADHMLETGTLDFRTLRRKGKGLREILQPVKAHLDGDVVPSRAGFDVRRSWGAEEGRNT